MLYNNLITSIRNLKRNKLLALINIIGLSVGISACMIIFLIADYELKFDRFQPDGDRIYRIHSQFSGVFSGLNRGIPTGVYTAIKDEFSGIESLTNFHGFGASIQVPNAQGAMQDFGEIGKPVIVRPEYFEVFNFYEWLEGDPVSALSEPYKVALTEKTATTYFGLIAYKEMIGREIRYRDSLVVTVSGIIKDVKENTDFYFTDFISYKTAEVSWLKYNSNDWNSTNSSSQLFIKLLPDVSIDNIKDQMSRLEEIYKEHNPEGDYSNNPQLQPLSDLHFNTDLGIFDNSRAVVQSSTLRVLIVIALLLLVVASINFVNLETAQASSRAKEVGIRKALGSSRSNLVVHFLIETSILTIISLIVSVGIAWWVLSGFEEFIPEGLELVLNTNLFLFLLTCGLTVTLLAGIYPAFVLSGFNPVQALKNKISGSGGSSFVRKGLTIFQFTFSQLLIISTLAIGLQIDFMLNKDLGFTSEAIIYFHAPWYEKSEKKELLLNELRQLSEISDLSLHGSPPSSNGWSSSTMTYLKDGEELKHSVFRKPGDPTFLDLYSIELLAGENVREGSFNEYLINETYLHKLGFEHPAEAIGETLNEENTIIGVVKDFHTKSLHSSIDPVVIFNSDNNSCFGMKLSTANMNAADMGKSIAKIESAYKTIYPDRNFKYYFLDETISRFYANEMRMGKLARIATFIAILISCLGLFGLSSFNVIKRTKEVGIRKVLGASVNNILYLLSKNSILLVVVAFLFAAPISYLLIDFWLAEFTYRMGFSVWIFLAAGLISIVAAFATVSIRSVRAAKANPVDSLRHE